MGIKCVVILTFTAVRKRKQKHSLKRGIEKLKNEINKKWGSYKKLPKSITPGIDTMLKKSRYGECIKISVVKGKLCFKENLEEIKKREQRFGKSLVFSNMLEAETGYLIDTYNEKILLRMIFTY
jgi:hypothetical protein